MSKKWIVTICIGVLACLSGAFWLLTHQSEKQKADINIVSAVPFDATFIVRFEKLVLLDDNFAESSAWRHFVSDSTLLLAWIKKTIETMPQNDDATLLLHAQACLSAHPLGKNELSMLCCIALPSAVSETKWANLVNAAAQPAERTRYQERAVFTLQTGAAALYFSYAKGVGLVSNALVTLQTAIRHIESGESLLQNEQFAAVAQTVGRHVDVGVFLNHKQLPRFINVVGNNIPPPVAAFFPRSADWTALDGQMTPNLINLNGFVFPSFTTDNYLSVFLNQTNSSTEAWNVLPSSSNFMMSISFSDAVRFLNDYNNLFDVRKELNSYKQKIADLDKDWVQNAPNLFCALYPAEIATANYHNHQVTLVRTSNAKYALEQLQAQAAHLKLPFKLEQETVGNKTVAIYHNPIAGLFETLLGSAFATDAETYFTAFGDWFCFSDSKEALAQIAVHNTQSLKKYLSQTDAAQYITGNACVTIVANSLGKADDALLKYFRADVRKTVTKVSKNYPLNVQILQLRPSNDKLYASLFALFEPQPSEEKNEPVPVSVIQIAGDERMRIEVINHYTKEKEAFVQFSDNSIGLQSKDGQWLWKRPFDEPILDTVIQIDYLRNGKLQLLFTTAARICLYDRNGNAVPPYPVKWKTPAVKGIAVFDYDKNRDYRIFVADADHTVRAYDKRIQPVEGWKPFKSQSAITRAPQFFRVASRDYIVVCGEQNTYILDRKGAERVKLETPVIIKPDAVITAQQQPAVFKITAAGKQIFIHLKDGKVELK
ncbi:MAG: hypothetical protein LBT48_00860 [Prevotellaceae bacterium]|jgi:hypothetical protein|nr:hypothetical protein [Prevotellaceae bacterium]